MRREGVNPSLSPSMDIQVSSNFERLLFEMLGRNAEQTAALMREFAQNGTFALSDDVMAEMKAQFAAYRLDDDGTLAEIAYARTHYDMLLDPHSAVGLYGARMARKDGLVGHDVPVISLACAHPAKFPDAVTKGAGLAPELPPHLSDLMEREEQFVVLDNDLAAIQAHVRSQRRQS